MPTKDKEETILIANAGDCLFGLVRCTWLRFQSSLTLSALNPSHFIFYIAFLSLTLAAPLSSRAVQAETIIPKQLRFNYDIGGSGGWYLERGAACTQGTIDNYSDDIYGVLTGEQGLSNEWFCQLRKYSDGSNAGVNYVWDNWSCPEGFVSHDPIIPNSCIKVEGTLDPIASQEQPYCSIDTGNPIDDAGNPINTGLGNKHQKETDIQAAMRHVIGFQRWYSSAIYGLTKHVDGYRFGDVVVSSSVGSNWRHTYDFRTQPKSQLYQLAQCG